MKGHISVSRRILAKCRNLYQCIWVETALVRPLDSTTLYCFDCFFHKYSTNARVEDRLLLSFNSKSSTREVSLGVSEGFRSVSAEKCDKKSIEAYLSGIHELAVEKIEDLTAKHKTSPSRLSFKAMLLGLILPRQRETLQEEGKYWGNLAKYRILLELISLLGYRNGVLSAEVDSAFILYGFRLDRREVVALIGDNIVELANYARILDLKKLANDLFPDRSVT
ncbi:MAG: hypothetical protein OWQ48_03380 [Desulfurococcus sp.]|nr:hypothetical protein [Desulfurococcus sp.]